MVRKRTIVPKKISRRKARIVKPMKIAALIVSAIQDLRETKGSTPKKIIGYISYASDAGEGRVKRQVKAALQRGVEYGILRRYRGQYFLPMGDELDRANRIALRFAKLPLPPTQHMRSTTDSPRKMVPLGGQRNSKKLNKNSQKTKRLVKAKSPLLSSSVSLIDTIRNIDEN
ncbi:uncharacterized protein LOC143361911 [Halictus rubicundus]|uniref:uncharacterized protein LOC143361911 n=1 Tax=Halictus rubicundus TaxID=77578 RepID=UPI004036B92A